jgi:ABC-type phosphate transport system permease subunit
MNFIFAFIVFGLFFIFVSTMSDYHYRIFIGSQKTSIYHKSCASAIFTLFMSFFTILLTFCFAIFFGSYLFTNIVYIKYFEY